MEDDKHHDDPHAPVVPHANILALPHQRDQPAKEAMGALAYTPSLRWQDDAQIARMPDLSDLAAAAEYYEKEPDAPMDTLMRLFQAGSSPGGARPKVLINEDGEHWLAKFASVKDTFDMVRIEAATLETARNAGIEVRSFLYRTWEAVRRF